MRKSHCLLGLILSGVSGTTFAGTQPLDTGYNYVTGTAYTLSDPKDEYWIKIASYEPPSGSVSVEGAYIYHGSPFNLGGTSRSVGPRASPNSTSGTHASNKAYAIYRKCFCLLSTQGASLNFRIIGDDGVLVWLNTIMNPLVGPVAWPQATTPQWSRPTSEAMFQEGPNCVYVLIEDYWAATRFSLRGNVSAPGLMPMMAKGNNASFEPCPCPLPKQGAGAARPGEAALVDAMFRAAQAREAASRRDEPAESDVESVPN